MKSGGPGRQRASFGSIRFRIVAAFLASMTTMLSAVVFLVVQFQEVSRLQALVTEGYLPLSIKVDQLNVDQQRIQTDIGRLMREDRRPGTGTESSASIYSQRLQETLQETQVHLWQAAMMSKGPEEVAVFKKTGVHLRDILALAKEWQNNTAQFVVLSESGNKPEASVLAEALLQDGRAISEEIDKLSKLLDDRIRAVTSETDRKRRSSQGVALFLTVAALVLSLLLIVAVLAALRPIGQLTARVQRLGEGDYTGHIDVRGGDEIAVLAQEFNRMVRALQHRDRTLVERAEELKRLSRYLASVVDSLQDGLFVVESGMVTLTNPAAERLWGVGSDAPPPSHVRGWTEAPGVYEERVGSAAYEVRSMPFGDSGVVVITTDVTGQRRALEELARSQRLALVGQMLAQITHEVRNPLNALSLNAEMLSDELGELDPAHHSESWDLLDTITGEIRRLTEVTAHYLQLARRPPARLVAEPLADLLRDVVRLVNAELERDGIAISLTCEPQPPQRVDGNQLRQALLNVVRNAAEAGAQHLELRLRSTLDEVLLELTDDGPGMTDEEVDRAFDPFFSTKASGTGLGLAITRQILEAHGGVIRVRSEPGAGTTLTLALPARPAPLTLQPRPTDA